MNWVAKFETLTPLFLAGARQAEIEVRLASIKSEMVFWWRALHFQSFFDTENTPNEDTIHYALKALHAKECALFGSADCGQGQFLMKLDGCDLKDRGTYKHIETELGLGGAYLGYGLDEVKTHGVVTTPARGCARSGTFTVSLMPRRHADPALLASLCKAIRMFGLLGGLGARKRRGFGSVRLLEYFGCACCTEPFAAPETRAEYASRINALSTPRLVVGRDFPLSAFARETEIRLWRDDTTSGLAALRALGEEFLKYRSWGRDGELAGGLGSSAKNFKRDHDWFKSAYQSGRGGRHDPRAWDKHDVDIPERANFGLPHNYFKKDDDRNLKTEISPEGWERRASPLMFHIAKLGTAYIPVATFFDTLFLPDGAGLRRTPGDVTMAFQPNPQIVRDFLDGAVRKSSGNPNSEGSATSPFAGPSVLCADDG